MTIDEIFDKGVDEAYMILWNMYTGNGKGCDFDTEKEGKLLNMINKIDNEMER